MILRYFLEANTLQQNTLTIINLTFGGVFPLSIIFEWKPGIFVHHKYLGNTKFNFQSMVKSKKQQQIITSFITGQFMKC